MCLLLVLVTVFLSTCNAEGSFWLTNPDQSVLFRKQGNVTWVPNNPGLPLIEVDDSQRYLRRKFNSLRRFQSMVGFGFTLTGGSAMLLHKMDPSARRALLEELFATDSNNIGVSYLRISIGASDLDDHVFSYDDMPAGQVDPDLEHFSLAPDQTHLIPILKEILSISRVTILGSPWSPPAWMKTNKSPIGGSLRSEYWKSYALYLTKYITGMKAEGIHIDAITLQNEPLNPNNNPSMHMSAEHQAIFIKKFLGPMFEASGVDTKILIYDHNADRPDYPLTILQDPDARKYVDGTAFHLYAGPVEALSTVHDAFPEKHIYFTEQWIGAPAHWRDDIIWHVKTLVIGASRNWSRTVLEWNLAADPNQGPHTPGGCDRCLGAITIDGNAVTRNPGYYNIAVVSKFVRPGSVRIFSNSSDTLPSVAFSTPTNSKVVVVLNNQGSLVNFALGFGGKFAACSLPAWSVGTYVW